MHLVRLVRTELAVAIHHGDAFGAGPTVGCRQCGRQGSDIVFAPLDAAMATFGLLLRSQAAGFEAERGPKSTPAHTLDLTTPTSPTGISNASRWEMSQRYLLRRYLPGSRR